MQVRVMVDEDEVNVRNGLTHFIEVIGGAMLGAKQLSEHWTGRLNDTLYAEVHGFHPIPISECAERSYRVFRKLRSK